MKRRLVHTVATSQNNGAAPGAVPDPTRPAEQSVQVAPESAKKRFRPPGLTGTTRMVPPCKSGTTRVLPSGASSKPAVEPGSTSTPAQYYTVLYTKRAANKV